MQIKYHHLLTRIASRELLCGALIVGVTFWGYYGALHDFFIMDDFDMITGHSTFAQFWQHWHAPVGPNAYRPLIDLVFIWDFYWWQWNPLGWHLSNLFFHIVNALLVYRLAGRLLQNPYAGVVAGTLFGLHVSHTEAVTWISARMDVVCTTFFLLSVLAFISSQERKDSSLRMFLLSLAYFACALFTKEMAVTLPLIVILHDLNFAPRWKFIRPVLWQKAKIYLPYFLLLLVYFGLRFGALHELKGGYEVKLFGSFIFKNLVSYFRFLAIPFTDQIFSAALVLNVVGIGVVTFVCVALSKESRFAILWLLITLLPVYAFDIGRGLYLASAGFCILLAMVLTFDVKNVTPTWLTRFRTALRFVQIMLIAAVFYRYGVALKESNAWWGNVAKINENVPLLVKALYPTFPPQSKVCLQNIALVFNQRFNSAFQFRYPKGQFRGIYVKDFENCATDETPESLRSTYFFHYNKDENMLYDVSYETRAKIIDQPSRYIRKLSQKAQHVLSKKTPRLELRLDDSTALAAIGLVTSLANGIEVPQGTVVARGHIEGNDGIVVAFDIVAGQDTAEWAIRFPNVRNVVQHQPPQAYRAWTVPQADGTIAVAQNYLKELKFQTPFVPARLFLELIPGAAGPIDLTVDVDRLVFYAVQEPARTQ